MGNHRVAGADPRADTADTASQYASEDTTGRFAGALSLRNWPVSTRLIAVIVLALLMGLLVYYGTINRYFYVVLTAVVMAGSVMVSYTRARAENTIPSCKVGFMERPERVVLLIIGELFDHMAPVLWVIAVLSNITVIHRMVFTYQEAKRLEEAQLRPANLPPGDAALHL